MTTELSKKYHLVAFRVQVSTKTTLRSVLHVLPHVTSAHLLLFAQNAILGSSSELTSAVTHHVHLEPYKTTAPTYAKTVPMTATPATT